MDMFDARRALLGCKLCLALLQYVLSLPYKPTLLRERSRDIWQWDVKSWSHFCALHALGVDDDPHNEHYVDALVVFCDVMKQLPNSWRHDGAVGNPKKPPS